jgi:hypothetical protein
MVNEKAVYDRLVQVAQAGKTIAYHEIAQVMGLNAEDPYDRLSIARTLDDISCSENAQGRPLISAVVVLPEIGYPGKGFFLLARELGLNTYCDDRSFFPHELKRVHEYWKENLPEFSTSVYLPVTTHSNHISLAIH